MEYLKIVNIFKKGIKCSHFVLEKVDSQHFALIPQRNANSTYSIKKSGSAPSPFLRAQGRSVCPLFTLW